MQQVQRPSPAKAAAFALAAIRETYEETGMMLVRARPAASVRRSASGRRSPKPASSRIWARCISSAGPLPRPSGHGVSTAGFSPRIFRRSPHRVDGFFGPDAELVELVWLPITEARRLDIPTITAVTLEELQERIATGMSHDHPVPFYRMRNNRFTRQDLQPRL